MAFAAERVRRLSSLASLSLLGWSVAATAQPAPNAPPAQPPTAAPNAPAPNHPAAAAKAPTAPQQPVPGAKAREQGAAKQPAAAPNAAKTATGAPANPGAPTAPAADAAKPPSSAGVPQTGESWVPNSTAGGSGTPGADGTTGPASPWPEGSNRPAAEGTGAPVYYVDKPTVAPGAAGSTAPGQPPDDVRTELDPMRLPIEEPPVPAPPRHVAPRTSLWVGMRVGYFLPFGDLWGRCVEGQTTCDHVEGTSFSGVASAGPMLEFDVGVRLGRNYIVYLGWERAQLGGADGSSPDQAIGYHQKRSESDYLAVGFRLAADPDDLGLVLDLAVGARRFRAYYDDDVELQLTEAPLESRLGIGIDIRTSRVFSLSPMLTLGIGSFGKADWVTRDYVQNAIPSSSDRLTHGWVSLQLGGHFDLFGKY